MNERSFDGRIQYRMEPGSPSTDSCPDVCQEHVSFLSRNVTWLEFITTLSILFVLALFVFGYFYFRGFRKLPQNVTDPADHEDAASVTFTGRSRGRSNSGIVRTTQRPVLKLSAKESNDHGNPDPSIILYHQVQAIESVAYRGGFSSYVFAWDPNSLISVQSNTSIDNASVQEDRVYFTPNHSGIWTISAHAHLVYPLNVGYFAFSVNTPRSGGTTWANDVTHISFTAGLNTYSTKANHICLTWTGYLDKSDRLNFGGLLEGSTDFRALPSTVLHAALVGSRDNDRVQARANAFIPVSDRIFAISFDTKVFHPQSRKVTSSNFHRSRTEFVPTRNGIWSVSLAIQSPDNMYLEVWMTSSTRPAFAKLNLFVNEAERIVALRRANSGQYHLTWTGYLTTNDRIRCLVLSSSLTLNTPYQGSGFFASFLTDHEIMAIQAVASTNLIDLGNSLSYAIAWEYEHKSSTFNLLLSGDFDQESRTKFFPPCSGIWSVQCVVAVDAAKEFGVYLTINSQAKNDQLLSPTPNTQGARTVLYEVGDGHAGAKTIHWTGYLESSDFVYCGLTSSTSPSLIASSTSLAIARIR